MNCCGVLIILSFLVLCHHLTDGKYPLAGDPLYVGCYTNFEAKPQTSKTNTIKECLTLCSTKSHFFGAFKNTPDCYCGDTIYLRVPSNNCNTTCAGNDGICGGNNHYAVYTAIPTYLGCFVDNSSRDLNIYYKRLKPPLIQDCLDTCHSTDVHYASTQHGKDCYCGKSYGKYDKSSESECDMSCVGQNKETCGGCWRNSVYSAKHIAGLNIDFSNVFHCAKRSNAFGVCTNKECLRGWKGNKCNQRDCAVLNGNCDVSLKCVEYKTGNHTVSECLCDLGFESTSIYDECKDIDECVSFPCEEDIEFCINTFGGYRCEMKP